MIYVLVLFLRTQEEPGFTPLVIEETFPSMISCWNAGFSIKARDPKHVVFFNCDAQKTESQVGVMEQQ